MINLRSTVQKLVNGDMKKLQVTQQWYETMMEKFQLDFFQRAKTFEEFIGDWQLNKVIFPIPEKEMKISDVE